jgi:GNAT superfamily N-acetyltransferase
VGAPQSMLDSSDFAIAAAEKPAEISSVRDLLLEYWESRKLEFTYFNFDREIANLPGDYSPPTGKLLLASCRGEAAGCVALRRLDREICEMKRMYLREKFRGRGFGRALADAIIAEARRIGYRKMRLDTIGPTMREALQMYLRMGFQEIPPYRHNPLPGAAFLELDL